LPGSAEDLRLAVDRYAQAKFVGGESFLRPAFLAEAGDGLIPARSIPVQF